MKMTNQKRRAGNFLLIFTVSLHSLIRLAKSHPTMNTSPWRGYVLQLLILSLARWRAKSEGCILASCKGRSRWQCINNNHRAYLSLAFCFFCFCFFLNSINAIRPTYLPSWWQRTHSPGEAMAPGLPTSWSHLSLFWFLIQQLQWDLL